MTARAYKVNYSYKCTHTHTHAHTNAYIFTYALLNSDFETKFLIIKADNKNNNYDELLNKVKVVIIKSFKYFYSFICICKYRKI